jgi:hypothetical protein
MIAFGFLNSLAKDVIQNRELLWLTFFESVWLRTLAVFPPRVGLWCSTTPGPLARVQSTPTIVYINVMNIDQHTLCTLEHIHIHISSLKATIPMRIHVHQWLIDAPRGLPRSRACAPPSSCSCPCSCAVAWYEWSYLYHIMNGVQYTHPYVYIATVYDCIMCALYMCCHAMRYMHYTFCGGFLGHFHKNYE